LIASCLFLHAVIAPFLKNAKLCDVLNTFEDTSAELVMRYGFQAGKILVSLKRWSNALRSSMPGTFFAFEHVRFFILRGDTDGISLGNRLLAERF
jgi:hypothetical protein